MILKDIKPNSCAFIFCRALARSLPKLNLKIDRNINAGIKIVLRIEGDGRGDNVFIRKIGT
jgi:hypothetical protein